MNDNIHLLAYVGPNDLQGQSTWLADVSNLELRCVETPQEARTALRGQKYDVLLVNIDRDPEAAVAKYAGSLNGTGPEAVVGLTQQRAKPNGPPYAKVFGPNENLTHKLMCFLEIHHRLTIATPTWREGRHPSFPAKFL